MSALSVAAIEVVPTLAECEGVIEQGRRWFLDVGLALKAIRDGRLYRDTHPTFEAYCRDRWRWTRQHVNRQIAAATRAQMEPMGSIQNERQARRLISQEEEAAADVIDYPNEWHELARVIETIEQLAINDAARVSASVPRRRAAATAKRLRKLGTYLGRIAWLLEGSEDAR